MELPVRYFSVSRTTSECMNQTETAFRRHGAQIYRYLLRRTGDHHAAEDLVQDVFADAAARLDGANEPPDSTLAWLYAVADRRFVDASRRRARAGRPLELVEVADRRGLDYGRAAGRVLGSAIKGLPNEQQRIVVMKLLEGRGFAEIADLVGISEGACKMRFARSLRLLRVTLSREGLQP